MSSQKKPAAAGPPLAVVLLSGGMDSAVAAAEVARTHRLACLHAIYDQRTANQERVCFGALAQHFSAERKLIIDMAYLGLLGGSALTDPQMEIVDADSAPSGIPATYVPFRNGHLLAAAVSWAEVLGAETVAIGAVEEDSSGYPDCRQVFYDAYRRLIRLGTRPETRISLLTPVIGLSKAEVVRRGQALSVPFHLTWSCYRSEGRACGRCQSCALRLKGFREAGVVDPIPYAGASPSPGKASTAADARVSALRAFLDRVRRH